MNRVRILLLAASLILPPWIVGCSADTGPGGAGPGPSIVEGAHLEVIGSATRLVNENAEELVEIRYVDADGSPIDGIVEFLIEGDPAGGNLSGHASPTNADGIATVTVRAATQTTFDLVATGELARDPAFVRIQVQPMSFGDLDYTVSYTGGRAVGDVETAIFTNTTCSDLARAVPSPRETQYGRLRTRSTFTGVEIGVPMAVYALGIDGRDNVAAEACADVTLAGPTASIEIPLADVAELFGGPYAVAETFDVTAGFNPTLNLALDVMTGLATDPAGYLVDYIAGRSDIPGWLRTALSSGATRDLVAGALRNAIRDVHVPGYVEDVVDLGHGIDAAFTHMTLDGELTFGEGSEFGTFDGTHLVTGIRFPLTDGTETTRSIRALANLPVEVGPTITMHEHTLAIPFGQVMEMVLHDVLLPRVPGSPATVHEFLGDLLDCSAISARLSGDATVQSIANAACDIGLTVIGQVIEDYITNLWNYDSLTLSGTANLVDSDGDYDRDRLEMGHANASWAGSSGTMEFTGTLSGARLDDEVGRTHPVRERMQELR